MSIRFSQRVAASFVLATGFAGFTAHHANAALLVTYSGTPGSGFISGAHVFDANTLGFEFKVGSEPLKVTSLGFWDPSLGGLQNDVMVGLWSTSNAQQLAAVTVPAGTSPTLVNDYRYVSLASPVTLAANTTYTIGYRSASGGLLQDGRYRDTQTFTPDISLVANAMGLRHSFNTEPLSTDFATQMPAMNLGDTTPLTGPNMQFTAVVPEPATGTCVLLFAAAGLGRRRHRRS